MYAIKLSVVSILLQIFMFNSSQALSEQLYFDFSSILHEGVGGGALAEDERLLNGTFYADINYPYRIYGFFDAKLGGKPINVLTSRGAHDLWSSPGRPIASMYMKLIPQPESGIANSIVVAFQRYDPYGNAIVISYDNDFGGGSSPANFTPRTLPEIDGSALPRGIYIIIGVFLMLCGNKKHARSPSFSPPAASRRRQFV